jgi:hypothetical protein
MAEPNNNFNGFFNDPRPAMDKFRPPVLKRAEWLMMLMSHDRDWFKDQGKRMIVMGAMSDIGEEVRELHAKNPSREECEKFLTAHATAFLMIVGDLLQSTQQYASQEEIAQFHTWEDEDEDSED